MTAPRQPRPRTGRSTLRHRQAQADEGVLMSEHGEQAMVIQWAENHLDIYPELRWLYSSLNGIFLPGPRSIVARIINHMKSEGMKKGIADLCLPVARRGYHGIYIEMKRDEGSKIQPEQIEFLKFISEQGYCDKICIGYHDATETLKWYLSGEKQ